MRPTNNSDRPPTRRWCAAAGSRGRPGSWRESPRPWSVTDVGLARVSALTVLWMGAFTLITDAGLAHVPHLRELRLGATRHITDAGLAHLSALTRLDQGDNTSLTDGALAHVPNLTTLVISGPGITDTGLRHVPRLTYLKVRPNAVAITDAGLVHVPHLAYLCVNSQSKITDAGLALLPRLHQFQVIDALPPHITRDVAMRYYRRGRPATYIDEHDIARAADVIPSVPVAPADSCHIM